MKLVILIKLFTRLWNCYSFSQVDKSFQGDWLLQIQVKKAATTHANNRTDVYWLIIEILENQAKYLEDK